MLSWFPSHVVLNCRKIFYTGSTLWKQTLAMPVTIPLPQEGLPSETEKNLLDCVISFIFRNYKKVKIPINLSVNNFINLFMFNWFVTRRSGSRIFLRRGCTTKEWRNRPVTLTNVYRIPVVLESHLEWGGGSAHPPLHPPPSSAPDI